MPNQMQIDVSNTYDAPDVKALKTSLMEYSKIITGSPLFNQNNNVDDITNLLYVFLEDLYIKEPEEVINFINQKPSKKLIENLFKQFGISDKLSRNFPDLLKAKTAYMLSKLFEAKGSNLTFDYFNQIIAEFYHHLNFYNVRIQQRRFVSKYETPSVVKKYYTKPNGDIRDEYGILDQSATDLMDDDIGLSVFATIHERYHNVSFTVKLFEKAEHQVRVKLNFTDDDILIKKGESEITVTVKKYDIYDYGVRDENQLIYELEPVLINDPLSVITEIQESDLRTSKYLMQKIDYFNIDYRNTTPMDVFPIITNVLYIQFGTSETMDTMEYLPDLVRMFAMTSTQDKVFSFAIDGTIIKLPMYEYTSLLTYIKLREVQFHNPGWEWGGAKEIQSLDFANMVYQKAKDPNNPNDTNYTLLDIYKLIDTYKDMPHDHDEFIKFKTDYFLLVQEYKQRKSTRIFNMVQFNEYLAGNIPLDFETFWIKLDEFYPDKVYIATEVVTPATPTTPESTSTEQILSIFESKQNVLMKNQVRFLYNNYNPEIPRDLFNLIAIQDDEFTELNSSVYDMLKLQFIDKYPRVIQKIDAIDTSVGFLELFLHNYKRMLVEVVKEDNLITYFVNDTFKRFLLAGTFKDEFFDPVVDLFQQYFFKAELSYQNSDQIVHVVHDKMQQVTCGTSEAYEVKLNGYFSEFNLTDNTTLMYTQEIEDAVGKVHLNSDWNVKITNDVTGEHNFTEQDDSVYRDGNKI